MKWSDIPRLTVCTNQPIDCLLFKGFVDFIDSEVCENNLILNPDFQRGHVWSETQQSAYIEYLLKGGMSGRIIYFNSPDYPLTKADGSYVCVDGLQRLTAIMRFYNNEIKVLDNYYSDFEGKPLVGSMQIAINNLQTRKEVIRWYLDLNTGGTPHSKDELRRVKLLYNEL